ncbi:MAG: RDD family protein [Planctomycetota bacterium]|jgi:uncharacterized RDD family membrane protein YckC
MAANNLAGGWRRLAAWCIDLGVIALYVAVLTGASFATNLADTTSVEPPHSFAGKLTGQALVFLVLTLPVILYFALCEASRPGATVGKRAMRLRLTTSDGRRVGRARSLLRSAMKLGPWEISHTAIWHVPGQPLVDEPTIFNLAGFLAALLLAGGYVVSLFLPGRRTLYDRLAGTKVSVAATSSGEASVITSTTRDHRASMKNRIESRKSLLV